MGNQTAHSPISRISILWGVRGAAPSGRTRATRSQKDRAVRSYAPIALPPYVSVTAVLVTSATHECEARVRSAELLRSCVWNHAHKVQSELGATVPPHIRGSADALVHRTEALYS
jgi:hypothetical protein